MKKTDADIFKEAMKGVVPLQDANRAPSAQPRKPKFKKQAPVFDETQISLSDHCSENITHEQFLSYAKQGLQPKHFRQLKQGKLAIKAELDLHGYNIEDARAAFCQFILECYDYDFRCVRVIHGKGYRAQTKVPLMKSKVVTWLKHMPYVLAFSSCTPRDGGTGALYILLERRKP